MLDETGERDGHTDQHPQERSGRRHRGLGKPESKCYQMLQQVCASSVSCENKTQINTFY